MADVIETSRNAIDRALKARDGADISWIHPPPEKDGWTLAPDALRFIDALVRETKPKHVIEFGAGLSTKVLARACVQMNSACAISSIDHDPQFGISDTKKYVESSKDLTLSSQIAPLVARDYGGKLLPTYLWDPSKLASKAAADLVLIDGPPVNLGGREGVLYQVMEFCRPGTIVLLDDASRVSELKAVEAWTRTLGDAIEVQRPPHFTKGMVAVIVREPVKSDGLWDRRVANAKKAIELQVPAGAAFVLVERDNFGDFPAGRRALPLVSRDGEDWGAPETCEIAINELNARVKEGATHFVLPWTSFWWTETYPEFSKHLHQQASSMYLDDLVCIVPLRK